MYAGKVVEQADVDTIFDEPHHPYTKGLLASIPRLGEKRDRLEVIKGVVPNPLNLPDGLPVQAPLPVRDADLRHAAAAPGQVGAGPPLALLADAGGRAARASGPTPPPDVAEAEAAAACR